MHSQSRETPRLWIKGRFARAGSCRTLQQNLEGECQMPSSKSKYPPTQVAMRAGIISDLISEDEFLYYFALGTIIVRAIIWGVSLIYPTTHYHGSVRGGRVPDVLPPPPHRRAAKHPHQPQNHGMDLVGRPPPLISS